MSTSPSTPPKRPASWAWVLGLAITALCLWWAVRGVHWDEFGAALATVNVPLLLLVVVVATLTFPLRMIRWRVMLRRDDDGPIAWSALWHAVAIGFMANNLLPARAGEFARAYVVKRQAPVRFITALATIGVERLFDGLLMLALMAVAIAAPSFPANSVIGGVSLSHVASGAAIVFAGFLVVAFIVALHPAPWLRLAGRVTRALLPERFAHRVNDLLHGLIEGLAVLRKPGRFLTVLWWSLVQWVVNALSFALCFKAFGLAVPAVGSFLLQGILGFGVAIPSSPGYAGVFETATKVTLELYHVDPSRALAYALTYHLTTFIPVTVLGLYSLSRARLHLGDLRGAGAGAASESA
ncbi:MAG TPA: lysylphosphatidylglycerol synthase transmembrane domain-containing protein [Gemmatimonadales bacterium]|nr:lysylphosphatidylglycerol synthase transmembrane domain-containing protein [Gemmatimonadales bacterium]